MKKKYVTPYAEKVVFDYSEAVVACSDWGWCNWYKQCNPTAAPAATTAPTNPPQTSGGSNVSSANWECKSPDYYNC